MLTIDRFEGELAVCEQEDGRMFTVEKALLPPDCVEGDAIEQKDGIYIKKDNRLRREQMQNKMRSLFKKQAD